MKTEVQERNIKIQSVMLHAGNETWIHGKKVKEELVRE
jgi:hypothetical protein